jgi:hypothetical protein
MAAFPSALQSNETFPRPNESSTRPNESSIRPNASFIRAGNVSVRPAGRTNLSNKLLACACQRSKHKIGFSNSTYQPLIRKNTHACSTILHPEQRVRPRCWANNFSTLITTAPTMYGLLASDAATIATAFDIRQLTRRLCVGQLALHQDGEQRVGQEHTEGELARHRSALCLA